MRMMSRFLLVPAVLGCVVGNLPDKELVIMTPQGYSFVYDTATRTEEPIPIVFGSRSEVRPYNSLSQRSANELFFDHYYIVPGKDSAIVLNRSPNGNVSQLVCSLPNCSVGLKFAANSSAGKPAIDLHVDCLSGSTSGAVDIRVATFSFAAKTCNVHSATLMVASGPSINRRTGAVVLYDSDSQDHSYVFVRNRTVSYYHGGSLSDPKSLSNLPDYEVEQIADFSKTQFVFETGNRSHITHTGFYDFSQARVSPIPGSLLPPHKPGRLVWSDDRSYLGSISHSDNTLTLANVAKPGGLRVSLDLPAGLHITSLVIVPLGDEVFIAFFAAGMGVYRGRVSDGSEGVMKIDGSSTACTASTCLGLRVLQGLQGLVLWQEKNGKGLVVFDLVKSERYGPFPTSDPIFRVAMLSPSTPPASVTTASPAADSTTAIAVSVVVGLLIVIAVAILVPVTVMLIRRRKRRNLRGSQQVTEDLTEVESRQPTSDANPSAANLNGNGSPPQSDPSQSILPSGSSLTTACSGSASVTPSSPASLSQDSDQTQFASGSTVTADGDGTPATNGLLNPASPPSTLPSGPSIRAQQDPLCMAVTVESPRQEQGTGGRDNMVCNNGFEKKGQEPRSEPYGAESQ